MKRFELDPSTGNADLAWLLVILFFVTTTLALRPTQEGVEAAEEGATPRVAVSLDTDSEDLTITSTGGRGTPAGEAMAWLAGVCASEQAPVDVACPDDATHQWCKESLSELISAAPGCRYRY